MSKNVILIAGGNGFIGKALISVFRDECNVVRVLTRDTQNTSPGYFYWNPEMGEIDEKALQGVTHIINLCGAGIADSRWSVSRKEELIKSRIGPAEFLLSKVTQLPNLKHYLSASGVNCYSPLNTEKVFSEDDLQGNDYISSLVKSWEEVALKFEKYCTVSVVRISFVVNDKGGGVSKMEKPIRFGIGAPLGSGKQSLPWIHLDDLSQVFNHLIVHELEGVYNAVAGNTTNELLTKLIADKNQKKILLPHVPSFMVKLIFGEMATILLDGIIVSNSKLLETGFQFKHKAIESCFKP